MGSIGAIESPVAGVTEKPPTRRLFILAPLVVIWSIVIYQIGGQWSVYEQYAYGWAIPFLCIYLSWLAWKCRPAPSLARRSGLAKAIIVMAAILFLPTRVIVEANPIWRAASFLIAAEAIAITLAIVYLMGGMRWLRHFAFPICFFLVSIPWPSAMEGAVIQFLTRLNTSGTIELLGFFGIPAIQHGNVIEISSGMVGIDEACSGVRSVQTTLMMTFFFGALNRLTWPRRFALIGGGLLLAVFCNLGRTFFLSWIASRDGIPAVDRWHDPAGVAILVACFFGIWGLAEWLKRKQCALAVPAQSNLSLSASQCFSFNHRSFSKLTYCLLLWLILVVVVTEGWFRIHENKADAGTKWVVKWPEDKSDFKEIPITEAVRTQLQCSLGNHYGWRETDGTVWQSFYLQWFPAQTLKERVTVHLAKTHRPEDCLVATGKVLESQIAPKILRLGRLDLPYRALVFNDRGRKLHVFFIAWEDGTPEGVYANMRSNSSSRLAAVWSGTRGKGQRVMEVATWGHADLASAEMAFKKLMDQVVRVEEGERQNQRK